jgi:uncharacterized protein YgiM (DUF1202 family)
MSNKNYTNYSKMSNSENATSDPIDVVEVDNKIDSTVATATIVVDEPVVVTPAEPVVATPAEPEVAPTPPAKPVKGKVVGCERLRVRKLPDKNSEVLGVVTEDSKIMIDPNKSTTNWYAVYTAAGLEGYCMKKYISTK